MKLKSLASACLLTIAADAAATAPSDSVKPAFSYKPEFHGTLRARFEQTTEGKSAGRFQVRNARLSVGGKIAPILSYFVRADFCDKGKFSMLDAYATFSPSKTWKIVAGQSRIPFSVDASRAVNGYLFTNRSFIGKQVGNRRGVGVKGGYSPTALPLYVEAGIFNATKIGDHTPWQTKYSYGAKARYTFGEVFVEAGFKSEVPDGIRINHTDFCVQWTDGRWLAEAEYVYKHYTNSAFDPCHAYNFMADYRWPIKTSFFNRMSVQARFDGMTHHSDGEIDEDTGILIADDIRRNRLTLGSTISYIRGDMHADLRLNYEQYFFPSGAVIPVGGGSKVSVEMILRF